MSIEWVRKRYGVPAKRGGRVEYRPERDGKEAPSKFGTITGAKAGRLMIRLDGNRHSTPYHPTWQLRYLDAAPLEDKPDA